MAEKKVTFEQAMARLEEIVKQLEQGDAPLEDALALFEEGTRLMKKCTTQLDKAEQKVSKLLAGPDGKPVEEPFEAGRCRALQDPMNYINDRRMLLDYQRDRLAHGLTGAMGRERERFARLAAALDALSPLKVLGRGYAIPQRSDGAVLRSAKEAMPGETLLLRMADGKVSCKVIEPAG